MVYIDIIIPLRSLSQSFNDHSTTVLSHLPPSGYIKTITPIQVDLARQAVGVVIFAG